MKLAFYEISDSIGSCYNAKYSLMRWKVAVAQ